MLDIENPLKFDGRIVLTDDHRYILDGNLTAPLSVTKLIEQQCSEPFDERAIVLKNLSSWRRRSSSKFHDVVVGLTDEQALEAVGAMWAATAKEGTSLHRQLELVCNGESPESPERHAAELRQFSEIRAANPALAPFRTELSLVATDEVGRPVLGGQLDLLVKDPNGNFHIVDFKRTDKDLDKNVHDFGRKLLGFPDNAHHRYSLQCSLYAAMLESQEGIFVESMSVLQVHPNLPAGCLTRLTDMRREARMLVDGLRRSTF